MSLLLASLVLGFALFGLQMTFECAPVCRMSSWASTFSVIPTICFGFQVSCTLKIHFNKTFDSFETEWLLESGRFWYQMTISQA